MRIVSACRELGLETVVGASEADRDGLAARLADRAVCIGPAPGGRELPAATTWSCRPRSAPAATRSIPATASCRRTRELAARAREHGLTFVGPPPEVIELTGDKLRARARGGRAPGCRSLPGARGRDADAARRVAARSATRCWSRRPAAAAAAGSSSRATREELAALLSLARSEAGAAFGDERLYVERFVASARHVEVQIAADEHGAVVHLGERDCSVQRRYQKVVEEAPAPALDAATARGAHATAAVRLRRARSATATSAPSSSSSTPRPASTTSSRSTAGSRSSIRSPRRSRAATWSPSSSRSPTGEPLGFAQDDVAFDGHAVECRLNAEDVAHGFMPSPGRCRCSRSPSCRGLRVDTHCPPGAVVPPYYDSLLAKLIAPRRRTASRDRRAARGARGRRRRGRRDQPRRCWSACSATPTSAPARSPPTGWSGARVTAGA